MYHEDMAEVSNNNSKERRPALERLSLPFTTEAPNPIVGTSLDSDRLQYIEIGLADEDHQNHFSPSNVNQSGEDKIHTSFRLGPTVLYDSAHKGRKNTGSRAVPLKPTAKSKAPKASKASNNKRSNRSPLQGVSLKKINAARTQQLSQKYLCMDKAALQPKLP